MIRERYLTQPFEVSIETLALCNAACTFCPYPTLDRKGTRLLTSMIERLIIEMSQFTHPFFFSPFKVNEPFLDARLIDICKSFLDWCSPGRLRLFTNGSALTERKIIDVAALSRVEHLWISLNSHIREDYAALMNLDFDRTARNIDVLHEAKESKSFSHPVVLSKVVEDDRDKNHDFVMYCRTRWPLFTPFLIKRDGWLGYVDPSNTLIPAKNCSRWFELSVMASGKVALCCMDGTGEYSIGDVNESSLLEIYNQPMWRERREASAKRQTYFPCNQCTY